MSVVFTCLSRIERAGEFSIGKSSKTQPETTMSVVLCFAVLLLRVSLARAQPQQAFPRAFGHGAEARGARGHACVHYVQTLADAGPGSLRSAFETVQAQGGNCYILVSRATSAMKRARRCSPSHSSATPVQYDRRDLAARRFAVGKR